MSALRNSPFVECNRDSDCNHPNLTCDEQKHRCRLKATVQNVSRNFYSDDWLTAGGATRPGQFALTVDRRLAPALTTAFSSVNLGGSNQPYFVSSSSQPGVFYEVEASPVANGEPTIRKIDLSPFASDAREAERSALVDITPEFYQWLKGRVQLGNDIGNPFNQQFFDNLQQFYSSTFSDYEAGASRRAVTPPAGTQLTTYAAQQASVSSQSPTPKRTRLPSPIPSPPRPALQRLPQQIAAPSRFPSPPIPSFHPSYPSIQRPPAQQPSFQPVQRRPSIPLLQRPAQQQPSYPPLRTQPVSEGKQAQPLEEQANEFLDYNSNDFLTRLEKNFPPLTMEQLNKKVDDEFLRALLGITQQANLATEVSRLNEASLLSPQDLELLRSIEQQVEERMSDEGKQQLQNRKNRLLALITNTFINSTDNVIPDLLALDSLLERLKRYGVELSKRRQKQIQQTLPKFRVYQNDILSLLRYLAARQQGIQPPSNSTSPEQLVAQYSNASPKALYALEAYLNLLRNFPQSTPYLRSALSSISTELSEASEMLL